MTAAQAAETTEMSEFYSPPSLPPPPPHEVKMTLLDN